MKDPLSLASEALRSSPHPCDQVSEDHILDPKPQWQELKDSGDSKRAKPAWDIITSLSRIRISSAEIQFIGSKCQAGGTYANVVTAVLVKAGHQKEEGRKVAVKKLRFIIDSDMTEEKFLHVFVNELRLLDKLSHPNIVQILGFVEDVTKRIAWLVFPWEDNGNLREFLRSGEWEIPERVSLINDVALGVEYLHTRQPPICHGDLKSLNVLVNATNRAVITDFGSARIVRGVQSLKLSAGADPATPSSYVPAERPQDELPQVKVTASDITLTLTGPACSLRWAPPEFFNGQPLDLASDIWALGWIAWEALTDNYPFEDLMAEWDVSIKIIEGRLPSVYHHDQLSQIHSLCDLMQKCWMPGPMERPSATEYQRALQWIPQVFPETRGGEVSNLRSAAVILRMGEIHRLHDRHEEASKLFEQGLLIARSTGDRLREADLLIRMAENERGQSKYVEAETSYIQALAIFDSMPNALGQAHALYGLGHVQRLRCKYAEAEASYSQALSLYESLMDDLGRAATLNGLGDVQRARSKHVEAGASYTQAVAIFGSIGNDRGRANALHGLGHIQLSSSEYMRAEETFGGALVIYESLGYGEGRANALLGLGNANRAQEKYGEAEAEFAQALAIYESIGSDLGIANALDGLGHVQNKRSNYLEAETSFTRALAVYDRIGDQLGRANAYLGLGDVQQAWNNHTQATTFYIQALAVYEEIGHDMGRMNCSIELASIHLRVAQYAEARVLITNAAAISEKTDNKWGKMTSKKLLDELTEAVRPVKPRSDFDYLLEMIDGYL